MGKKELIAQVLDKTLISRVLFAGRLFYGRDHIRVVNYHSVPPDEANNFEAQLRFFKKRYSPVSHGDLVRFFETGIWHKDKPGLIISFDDGWRDNIDNAVPLLNKYGFVGWFFIPAALIDAGSRAQMDFVGKTEGRYRPDYPDGRYLMSWEELRKLSISHVVGCHTATHHRMDAADDDTALTEEIVVPKELMEKMLRMPVDTFCWVGGEERTYTRAAANKIREAGYHFSFMTNTYPLKKGQSPLQIQRTNVESRNSLPLVRFQLSVLMDLLYRAKRKRVLVVTGN